VHPEWTYDQVIDQILATVDTVPALAGLVATGGRLNAFRAVAAGPRIVASSPALAADLVGPLTVSQVLVTFNEAINPATFTPADILEFKRLETNESIAVQAVEVAPGSNNRQFNIRFAPIAAGMFGMGEFRLVIGPQIQAADGRGMDQDSDGVHGEAADRFTLTFSIEDSPLLINPAVRTTLDIVLDPVIIPPPVIVSQVIIPALPTQTVPQTPPVIAVSKTPATTSVQPLQAAAVDQVMSQGVATLPAISLSSPLRSARR
jgi:hypothetical protein